MAIVKLKVARIGNSRGVRLPAASLKRYRIGDSVLMEELSEGILLRPAGPVVEKLSWEETATEMAASREEWSDWEAVSSDGLEALVWKQDAGQVAERPPPSGVGKRRGKRR